MNGVTVKEEQDDIDIRTVHKPPPPPVHNQHHKPTVDSRKNCFSKPIQKITASNVSSTSSSSSTSGNSHHHHQQQGEKPVFDDVSQKGQFGWTVIGQNYIPYIFRGETKFCSVRMLEMKVLYKYVNAFKWDFYNCVCVKSYYVTEAEAKLLNEINFVHCDFLYGRDQFNGNDLIVNLNDALDFYQFLEDCYLKLTNAASVDKCGFIRINNESVVPFTKYNGLKLVPLFYFEGETESLKGKSLKLKGWPLSYLKFCCKVQGIRNELFVHDSCTVVSIDDIKNHFPPGSIFQDYWPSKTALLTSNNGKVDFKYGKWAKEPMTPPIFSNVPLNQNNNYSTQPIPSTTISSMMPNTNYPSVYRNIVPRNDVNGYATSHMQAIPHGQHHQSQVPKMPNFRTDPSNYIDVRKLILIPDPPTTDQANAYQIQKVVLENKTVSCVNMKPHIYTDLLITLIELHEKFFFKNTDFQNLCRVIQVLTIPIYKANNSQIRLYVQHGKHLNLNELIALVGVRDIVTFMPQIKYMLNGQISL
ncbi:hypothetical protein QE152_g33969 [Popillia japonica]|uniref:Uncharacterized protein n=1 Tax=Popillia japonica TaxID=7064 RepID=A0AAW1IVS5_POPJA